MSKKSYALFLRHFLCVLFKLYTINFDKTFIYIKTYFALIIIEHIDADNINAKFDRNSKRAENLIT